MYQTNFILSLIKILLGLKTSNIFHKEVPEYQNLILEVYKIRLFRFFKTKFRYNLYISDIYYNFFSKSLALFKLPVPLMFEPGPTFISTNNEATFNIFCEIKNFK